MSDSAIQTIDEVQLKDIPFLPASIDSDEDLVVINAMYDLGAPINHIVGRMDEDTRTQEPSTIPAACIRMRQVHNMLPRGTTIGPAERQQYAITPAQERLNTARGRVAGAKLPGEKHSTPVFDMTTGLCEDNWVHYPLTSHPKSDGENYRRGKVNEEFEKRRRERERVIARQTASQ